MRAGFFAALGGLVVSIFLTVSAAAQQDDIQGTIQNQFDAFEVDDFETAFTFATPSLQRLFQSPQNFQRMVTQGYPMVWRFSEVTFLDLRQENGLTVQTVRVVDAEGVTHLLAYLMVQTDAGWRIGGVQILDAAGVAA
ncbi:DUF4864 domain-containing protein [Sulfitobacter sp. TSTF-M16]|uniref:DUF4864 domain-containing protein n=2 Tax=Sulfitobacter aestuariivivens TaxID=2766981 RepID=A0A927HGX4_9RHOB|nr:DUF4864 domain-containing protein [Sulfitobacter aestuariivivens]